MKHKSLKKVNFSSFGFVIHIIPFNFTFCTHYYIQCIFEPICNSVSVLVYFSIKLKYTLKFNINMNISWLVEQNFYIFFKKAILSSSPVATKLGILTITLSVTFSLHVFIDYTSTVTKGFPASPPLPPPPWPSLLLFKTFVRSPFFSISPLFKIFHIISPILMQTTPLFPWCNTRQPSLHIINKFTQKSKGWFYQFTCCHLSKINF